jgi:GAF domain-containing protein
MTGDELLDELRRVAAAVGPALAPPGGTELLQSITDAAKDLFSAAACSLALLDEEEDELEFKVASGAGADAIVGERVPLGRGVAGWVVASGQPIAVDDVTNDPRFGRDVAERSGYVPRSILAMPLETERNAVGVISVLDRKLPADALAAQREMAMLGLFARQAALAIEGQRLFAQIGRVLLTALADAGEDRGLRGALQRAAEDAAPADRDLLDIAAAIAALEATDPPTRALAVRLLREIASYADGRPTW